MTVKKFSILTSIIVGIIFITTIILGCVKADNGLNLSAPKSIILYNENSIIVELTKEATPSKYKTASNKYNDMTKLNMFDYMFSSKSIKDKPTQDLAQKYATWNKVNKTNKYTFELVYDEKQTVVVEIDGDTRVVEFYALIMTIDDSIFAKDVLLYFSKTKGNERKYTTSPIIIKGKQRALYKYIATIDREMSED